jgi:hypothetical protein
MQHRHRDSDDPIMKCSRGKFQLRAPRPAGASSLLLQDLGTDLRDLDAHLGYVLTPSTHGSIMFSNLQPLRFSNPRAPYGRAENVYTVEFQTTTAALNDDDLYRPPTEHRPHQQRQQQPSSTMQKNTPIQKQAVEHLAALIFKEDSSGGSSGGSSSY